MTKNPCLYFLIIIQYINGFFPAFSNGIDDDEKLIGLIKKYPKEKVVILDSEVNIRFNYERKNTAYIIHEQIITFQSLKQDVLVDVVLDYDMFSEITSNSLTGLNVKLKNRTCGNVEIEGIFHSDKKICRYTLQFFQIGTIAKLKLVKRFNDLRFYTSEFFHEDYPVLIKSINFYTPPNFDVVFHEFNFERFNIDKTNTTDKQGNNSLSYNLKDIEPQKDEQYMMGYSHNYPHIIVQTKAYRNEKGVKFTLIENLDDLYNWYASLTRQLINDTTGLHSLVKEIIKDKASDYERIKTVFYWIQDNIRYCAFESGMAGYKPEEAATVLKNRYGDCKGMANLTKNLLKLAGYDARLCWIGTNYLKYDYSIPSMVSDNHMICCVILGSDTLFLDPTETLCSIGDYAERIQGRQVLIENGESFILSRIPVQPLRDYNEHRKIQYVLENNLIVGKGFNIFNGEKKRNFLQSLYYSPRVNYNDIVKRKVLNEQKEFEILSHSLSDIPDRDSILKIEYTLKSKQQVQCFDVNYYIQIDPFKDFCEFRIEPERISDINLNQKIFQKTEIVLNLPKNYAIKEIPENERFEKGNYSAEISYTINNQEISYIKVIKVGEPVIKRNEFSDWAKFVDFLENSYKKSIILKSGS
ncbi:MAG: transglutaminase domain-containing protein [Bacteroidales bacterium]|nr:transglutaminase domain-containing protein [Bacteroidales bacterium]